jgi:hypothetical protein
MKQIVVLQRGWVVIGEVTQDKDELIITGGGVIRKWGTKKGLGEIAKSGPTPETIIDPTPPIRAHVLAVVMRIDCEV